MTIYRNINGVDFGVNINKGNSLLCTPDVAKEIDGDIFEFVEYLYSQTEKYTPMIATWEITNCCNFKCPFCYINTPKKPRAVIQSFETMKGYIDDLVNEGLLIVYLTGGEVLSVPNFKDIYTYLKKKGVFVVLLSNLSLLNEEHISLFTEYPPMRITSSIYGMTEKQFTSVTGQPNEICQSVLENIIRIQKMGIKVTCQMPVNKYTVNDLIPISEWCYEHGIRFTFSNELTDSYYHESRSDEFIDDADFEKLKSQIRQIKAIKSSKTNKIEKKFGYKHHFDCISGKHTFAVSYDGHLRPCFNIWESDLISFDGSLSMKTAMDQMRQYIESMKKQVIEGCNGCEAVQICSECIYTHLKHKINLSDYISNRCKENKYLIQDITTQLV